jgi:hypothetical protein
MTQADSVHSTPPTNTSANAPKNAAPGAAADEKTNHFGNLEEQICDLLRAADLSVSALENLLEEGRIEKDSVSIYLPDQFAERLIFAAFQVKERAQALKDFLYSGGTD